MENVRAQYGADADTDNSGSYPHERRLVCDSDTFRILLLCTAPEKRYPAYTETVKALGDSIIRKALPGLKLTPDFCIIDAEYD